MVFIAMIVLPIYAHIRSGGSPCVHFKLPSIDCFSYTHKILCLFLMAAKLMQRVNDQNVGIPVSMIHSLGLMF
jgi:hypothetical protein